jgi:hypothetical protein
VCEARAPRTCVDVTDGALFEQCVQLEQLFVGRLFRQILHRLGRLFECLCDVCVTCARGQLTIAILCTGKVLSMIDRLIYCLVLSPKKSSSFTLLHCALRNVRVVADFKIQYFLSSSSPPYV